MYISYTFVVSVGVFSEVGEMTFMYSCGYESPKAKRDISMQFLSNF